MKNKIQMQVAKHMIAVWIDENDPVTSLQNSFELINNCWWGISRRELRTWAKALCKNPERYEFTGYAYKVLSLNDFFDPEEVQLISDAIDSTGIHDVDRVMIERTIIHHKHVYKMSTEFALKIGIAAYFGNKPYPNVNRRPLKPKLKELKK